ncbi:hypothetical protein AA309_28970 [Microvirga vignae]|uniref:Uncharacterized protein n=1 Tax=Microvirga vignae TaxID=1225564 RepID=A0A0H1R4Z4_9HYPH|nr:hypothetical protein AA309_28970 [Microvirga vignae]
MAAAFGRILRLTAGSALKDLAGLGRGVSCTKLTSVSISAFSLCKIANGFLIVRQGQRLITKLFGIP